MTATVSFRVWRTSRRALAAAAVLWALAPAASRAAGCDWPMYGHDPGHSFAQSAPCAQINATNVGTLTERWTLQTGDFPVTASTTVENGVAYVGDWSGKMHAIDVASGSEVWTFQIDDNQNVYPGRIANSAAVGTMRVGATSIRVLVFGGGATLYAVDPGDGALLAKQDLDPRVNADDSGEIEIESSPVIAHFANGSDRVLVGMDVHNDANVGRTGLHSLELVANPSGPTPYRFQLVYKFDPETRTVRSSITDGSGTGRGCGGIWSSPVFDPAALSGAGLVVFGTSNCENPAGGSGEAESEGMYALNATTGSLQWDFHPRPFNNVDDDFGASANLLPGGLVGNGGKDGFYYARNRITGAQVWTSHPAQSGHINDQFAIGGIIGTPAVGLSNGEAAIFIASGVSTTIGDVGPPPVPDPTLSEDPQRMLSLHAISAVDGRILWRSEVARQTFGAPTYANGIVFVPNTFGFALQAYDANNGTLLAEHPLPGAPSSSPTIVGNTILIGTGTSADPVPNQSQQHGLHAFSIPASPVVPGAGILLDPQNNVLNAYDLSAAAPTTTQTTPIPSHVHAGPHDSHRSTNPYSGHDVNGQGCAIQQADGSVRFLMGEDSDEAPPHSGEFQGWGLFAPTGGVAGPWIMTDKLVPLYNFSDPPNDHKPDNTGCAVSNGADGQTPSADDKLFVVDLGVGAFDVDGVGSLYVFYRDAAGNFSQSSPYCVLDNNLTTAGYLAVHQFDGDAEPSVLVPESGRSSGGVISRYSPPFPAPPSCPDPTLEAPWHKTPFIQDATSFVPISIAKRATPNGDKWLVGNVAPPMVNEYNLDGTFSRPVMTEQPTPGVAGIAVDPLGNAYVANLGLAPCDTVLCPVDGLGTIWKVSFDPATDQPLPPVLLQSNLTYPEGMSIVDATPEQMLPEPPMLGGAAAALLLLAVLHRRRERR